MFAISRTPEFVRGAVNVWTDKRSTFVFQELRADLEWLDVEGPMVWSGYRLTSWYCPPERAMDVISVLLSVGLVQGRYNFFRLWDQRPLPFEIESILSAAEDSSATAHGLDVSGLARGGSDLPS